MRVRRALKAMHQLGCLSYFQPNYEYLRTIACACINEKGEGHGATE